MKLEVDLLLRYLVNLMLSFLLNIREIVEFGVNLHLLLSWQWSDEAKELLLVWIEFLDVAPSWSTFRQIKFIVVDLIVLTLLTQWIFSCKSLLNYFPDLLLSLGGISSLLLNSIDSPSSFVKLDQSFSRGILYLKCFWGLSYGNSILLS